MRRSVSSRTRSSRSKRQDRNGSYGSRGGCPQCSHPPPASRPQPSSARWSWEARSSSAQGVDRMPLPLRRRSKHRRRRVPVPRSPRSRPTKRTATEFCGPATQQVIALNEKAALLDPTTRPGDTARLVVNLTQVVAVATNATDALALLHPPSFVAADHAADVTHHRDSIAILGTAIAKLPGWRSGRRTGDDRRHGAHLCARRSIRAEVRPCRLSLTRNLPRLASSPEEASSSCTTSRTAASRASGTPSIAPPDGSLYAEELFGVEGFTGRSSLLYHLVPPTQTYKIEPVGQVKLEAADDGSTAIA